MTGDFSVWIYLGTVSGLGAVALTYLWWSGRRERSAVREQSPRHDEKEWKP